jgi:hypothetical protein
MRWIDDQSSNPKNSVIKYLSEGSDKAQTGEHNSNFVDVSVMTESMTNKLQKKGLC